MEILLSITFQGETSEFKANGEVIVIGRSQGADDVDLDLGHDTRVSRRHARITQEDGRLWLEDLGSRHGTKLNGTEIKGAGKRLWEFHGEAVIGDTKVRLVPSPVEISVSAPKSKIGGMPAVRKPVVDSREPGGEAVEQVLEVLSKLPLRLATETKLDRLCQAAVETVLELFPQVRGCALLLKDRERDQLSLEAYAPKPEIPTVSEQLANRAISARNGFIWPDQSNEHMAQYHPAGSGMYSPLIWNETAIGVICVNDPDRRVAFSTLDLHLLAVLSNYAGMAIAQHTAREALAKQTEFTNRLFSSRFPPKVRNGLMRQAADDSLTTGTRRSRVTVLNSDIRQFTKLSEELGPRWVGDLLNEYFPPLIEAIFAYGGTVERFAGDGIFAVFGAPEPDDSQQEHAVRAALEMQKAVCELNEAREKRRAQSSKIGIGIGIGIDSGDVLSGFIGNAERLEFTVVGNAANYASRYCSSAAPGEILISQNVHSRVWKLVVSEPRPGIATKNGILEGYVVRKLKVS